MKKLSIIALAGATIFFGSCGINNALIANHNMSTTQVQLAGNNFKVTDKVSGSADVTYILCFGGMKKKRLYENAYSSMMDKANLKGSARAVTNAVTEEHLGGVPPFYYKRTVTVSGNVIEFTK